MYCSLGQNQFFDDAGAPLSAGRVKIYAKGSDTLLPIYEDNGGDFVPAQNPVITANDGRIPTIFWPAALVDVVVEKSNGDGTYTELDSYVAGLDLSSVEAVQGVGSITELRSIMPSENMVVQVNGYYTAGDSPTRKYLWVEGAANTDDGGYVVASYRDSDGRWVMLWDDPEFLPASLYGVMCGYSGYAKNSNIPALEALGHYVLVGSVRVEVPPVILFDWRMAQPTSGQSSPISYYWSGTMTTTHYVACDRGVTFSTTSPPTIHCAGVRGESYAYAYWLVDQNYTSNDPFERISTLMFRGNTQAMHDAFMACAACSKVKVVELSQDGTGTTLYDLLDGGDSFAQKIVIDYTNLLSVQYATGGCVWIQPYLGKVRIGQSLTVGAISASSGTFSSDLLTDILTVTTRARIGGNCTVEGDTATLGKLIFSSGIRFKDDNTDCIENPNDASYYPHSPKFPHGLYVVGALNASTLVDSDRKMHIVVPGTGLDTVDLTTDSQVVSTTSFYNSKYKLNDIIIVSNTGSSTIIVKAASGNNVVIQGSLSCAFIKVDSVRWNLISYVQ